MALPELLKSKVLFKPKHWFPIDLEIELVYRLNLKVFQFLPEFCENGVLYLLLRWPTTVTSKQNAHVKFKSLTSNSNHSQQIQIAHSKLQIHHSKLQIIHIKYKSFTSNTNRSQQTQIAHSKYKYAVIHLEIESTESWDSLGQLSMSPRPTIVSPRAKNLIKISRNV